MTGCQVRLGRIFRQDGRAAVVALDHAQFKGAVRGLESMPRILEAVVAGGADAVILNPGPARSCVSAYAGRCALIVRVTGASTDRNPIFDYHRRICTVEQALRLGADAVIAMGFVGNEGEAASLSLMAEIAGECARFGMPLIAEVLPAAADHFQDPEWIGLAARAASEIGADVIKAYVTGTEADEGMIRTCGAPFLAAGGPKAADPVELAASAIRRGASGIAFGRNVFESEDPRSTVRDLCRAVHDGG